MAAVNVQKAEWLNKSVNPTNAVFFVVKFGTCLAKQTFIEAEFIETEVLNEVLLMGGHPAKVLLSFKSLPFRKGLIHL